MRLSESAIAIERAFHELTQVVNDLDDTVRRRSVVRNRHFLPRAREHSQAPVLPPPTFPPSVERSSIENKAKLVLLAAFEATYHEGQTPVTPDMVPLVIDTGASNTISPYATDFVGEIRAVQDVEIKGIASGLKVAGVGTVVYSFSNDAGEQQEIRIDGCLLVPQCTVRLLCPRQIGSSTGVPTDGFTSTSTHGYLTVQGKRTTLRYDSLSQLPILYTKSGIESFRRFCLANYCQPVGSTDAPILAHLSFRNLTPRQLRKKKWHDRSNHSSYTQVNQWLRSGLLPDEDPDLADEPDPDCAICRFGKAHKKAHKSDTGHIDDQHSAPGEGISADQMEAGYPGRIISTKGLPSQRRYHYVNFWVDHYSRFVYVTMHETKEATELVKSKQEFQDYAARFGVKLKNTSSANRCAAVKKDSENCIFYAFQSPPVRVSIAILCFCFCYTSNFCYAIFI